jgi:hypothetical protein
MSTETPGALIPSDFIGLSFEMALLLPDADGVRYFRPGNIPLITLFRTLGIKSLRIGGNTGDRDFKASPTEADIVSLFQFARAAGVKVIYCLRLLNADPAEQARIAKFISEKYGDQLECFSIGQEPSAYPETKVDTRRSEERMGANHEHYSYAVYATNWSRAACEIVKSVPEARFAGPGVHLDTKWPLNFLADLGKMGHVSLLTSHLYPGGPGGKVTNAMVGRDRMLSGEFEETYRGLAAIIPAASSRNIPFRIEEANNFFNGGAKDVSDTYAASLWGLDFLWWWAVHGAAGVNFHTGNKVAAGNVMTPCKYTAFYSTSQGCQTQPLGYGIKTFELGLGASGHIMPLKIVMASGGSFSAYAILDDAKVLHVTFINREHGVDAHSFHITLNVGKVSALAKSIALTSPHHDAAAKTGITIGGSEVSSDGTWHGSWASVSPASDGTYSVILPPASGLVVQVPLD